MFHILETRPTKVRWCWLARERGTSTASPLVSTVLVLRVATLGGCRNPARCGTPCTCALWNTTGAATSLRCSSEPRGLTGSNWTGGSGGSVGSAASTSRRARRWMLSSLRVCEAAHDIQERAAYSKLQSMRMRLSPLGCPRVNLDSLLNRRDYKLFSENHTQPRKERCWWRARPGAQSWPMAAVPYSAATVLH
ncbi:hypothetical protein GWK47_013154 [Chionoecetes opilio]|uniref:Uncharacterized protein n=1 Tax=Chionoecetes opilio TaxID=41210 RepID=A0A8J4Y1D5_CHIOP|nr:hypothetical protein GWK47_013154 [Chionoecetes opilio]